MKRITALLVALLMALAMVPAASLAEEDLVTVTFMMSENANQLLRQDTPVLNYIKEHWLWEKKKIVIPSA